MADDDMEGEAAPADSAAGMATAMIVLTTVMLLGATWMTLKILGEVYHEGILKT